MFDSIKNIKEYFGKKTDNDSCEFDFDESLKNILDKRFDREGRAYHNLTEQYDNFDELPEKERNAL